MISKVLITGATGTIGLEIIRYLSNRNHQLVLTAAVRDPETDAAKLSGYDLNFARFDFKDLTSYAPALKNCDILFLLLPAGIPKVEAYFKELIGIAKDEGVKHIVFLSAQGVEKSKLIPHHKIEQIIVNSRISYTFLRPAYFMQNFTTTLRNELVTNKRIFLPAGHTKFTLIDVRDIADVIAKILADTSKHINKSYELTSNDNLTFKEMADDLKEGLASDIQYVSPGLFKFFMVKKKEKMPVRLILAMILLHYLPRFQKEPSVTKWVELITGRPPISFEQFISSHKHLLSISEHITINEISK